MTLQPGDEGLVLAVINQSATEWRTSVTLRRLEADGSIVHRGVHEVTVGGRSVLRFPVPGELVPAEQSAKEFLVADADGLRALHFPVRDKDFAYPRPDYDVTVEEVAGKRDTVDVVVSAHTLLRDLLLQADRLDPRAAVDQGLRTLLPGEQARFRVTGCSSVDAKRARSALFCSDTR